MILYNFPYLIGIYISVFHNGAYITQMIGTLVQKLKMGLQMKDQFYLCLTWPLAGSRPSEAVGAVCLLRPLDPEPLPHLPPKYTHIYCFFLN